jgi:shikimate dehydrogenase
MPYTDFTGHVLIVGAGGAARGIVQALPTRDVTIVNRTVERAKALADTFGVVYTTFDEMDVSRYDVIIQTTSVGMDERSTPLSLEGLRQNTVVCDIIYRPLVTPMLQEAKSRGANIVTGVAMFVGQGALSFEKWTGVKPDETVGKKLIEGLLEE